MNLFNACRASLELRDLRNRIERGIRQLIDGQLLTPVIRDEDRVRPNRPYYQHWKDPFTTTRYDAHTLTIRDLQLRSRFRMNFDVRLRTLLDQESDPSRLITG